MKKEYFTCTREIGIDAMHRVPTHGSKCKRYHGHRYTIRATCLLRDKMAETGTQQGMVIDFGFLKEEMMLIIDQYCDHGCIAWINDFKLLERFYPGRSSPVDSIDQWLQQIRVKVEETGFYFTCNEDVKLYIIPEIPTAENLAKHWFERLAPQVKKRSEGYGQLLKVVVDETPNCSAQYSVLEIKDEEK